LILHFPWPHFSRSDIYPCQEPCPPSFPYLTRTRNGEGLGTTQQSPIKRGKSPIRLSRKGSGGNSHSHPRGLRMNIASSHMSESLI
jgi:hypothetical protein